MSGDGVANSQEHEYLSNCGNPQTGLAVWSGWSVRARERTFARNLSLCSVTRCLVVPSDLPSPRPCTETDKCESSLSPKYSAHCLASCCNLSQLLSNSRPVLVPDWRRACHLTPSSDPDVNWCLSCIACCERTTVVNLGFD